MNLLINFLLTTGIIILLGILFLLLRQKKKELPKSTLALIFILLFFVILHTYGELNSISLIYNISFVIADTFGFLLGPLLYLYIKSIYQKRELIFPGYLKHFIPALLYLIIISVPFLISTIKDEYLFSYLNFLDKHQFLLQIQAIYLVLYIIIALRTLKIFKKLTRENYSNLTKKDLAWIRYLLLGILLVLLINSGNEIYSLLTNGRLSFDNTVTTIAMIIVIVYLGYFGISQSRILLPDFLETTTKLQIEHTVQKENSHHLSTASENEIEILKKSLYQLLEEKKPYLDENLNLKSLSEMIPTTDRKLSALFNHYLNTNFYDFINKYRVDEVKKKMGNTDFNKYTILALALDSGFNSKSSFNRIFKKETGISPSAYKNQL